MIEVALTAWREYPSERSFRPIWLKSLSIPAPPLFTLFEQTRLSRCISFNAAARANTL